MSFIPVTLGTAGILGIIYMALCGQVSRLRMQTKVMTGDGDGKPEAAPLVVAMRAQANFSEYVPLILILLGGIEMNDYHGFCLIMALLLIAARIAHPVGMFRPAPNPFRAAGAVVTWGVLILTSLVAIFIAL